MSNIKYLICFALLAAITSMQAQTTKPVTLTHQTPFTDAITLTTKAGPVNVTASFVFDEQANTVAVKLQSDRKLFVFWQDIKYKKAFCSKHLRTDRLSYPMTGYTSDQFRKARHFKRSLPKPRDKYVFHTWFEPQGLRPQGAPRSVINDSVCQTFAVLDTAPAISLRLRDILLVDDVKQKGITHYFDISFAGDINTVYSITLQRNPCFGKDAQIQMADSALSALTKSYNAFKGIYEKGVVNSEEGEKMFLEIQGALQILFPLNQDSSACPAIQEARTLYNQLTDSISALTVTVQTHEGDDVDHELNARTIRTNARTLDNNVARWLVSKDQLEKSDLIQQSKDLITETYERIAKYGTRTQNEREAVAVFRKAEQYFKRTCR
ncbi:MAG: hypothetical protein J5612_01560 [Paludibacteraceae bacterium]|nr:hypothetical protein [Paludibacteraceae bacterium]